MLVMGIRMMVLSVSIVVVGLVVIEIGDFIGGRSIIVLLLSFDNVMYKVIAMTARSRT